MYIIRIWPGKIKEVFTKEVSFGWEYEDAQKLIKQNSNERKIPDAESNTYNSDRCPDNKEQATRPVLLGRARC